jgi:erythromycin esterase
MGIQHKYVICILIIAWLLLGCQNAADVPSPTETIAPAFPADLLDDAALAIEPDPNAPLENQAWAAWIQANHHPIRSLTSEHYDDLQFLKPLLAGRIVVQLGEPAHGVAEINTLRARLVKFLHEEMAYDVIAFESGLFECYTINTQAKILTPTQMLTGSVFGIWHTTEMRALFDYIQATQATTRPLTLSGIDIQPSNRQTAAAFRPQFLRDTVAKINPAYADQVYDWDTMFLTALQDKSRDIAYWQINGAQFRAKYQALLTFLELHTEALHQAFPRAPQTPTVARQVVWSILQFIDYLQALNDPVTALAIRDIAMADNLGFMLNTLYPGKKVIVWAHNAHIRYHNQDVRGDAFWLGRKTMGRWMEERYFAAIYTIGFYLYRGQIASNNRQLLEVHPVKPGSLESILYRAGRKYVFVDLLHQTQEEGNEWMFKAIQANELTLEYEPIRMVPRDQYDGIIFIDTVHPPEYLY